MAEKRNMTQEKTPMPEQDPNVRNKNFEEVALGYTQEMAVNEAARCLGCKNPACVQGCPVNVKIPEFIKRIEEGDFKGAYLKLKETNSLPAVCGRVCPQESQCESKCVRGKKGDPVGIGRLERFASDWYLQNCDDKRRPDLRGRPGAAGVRGDGVRSVPRAGRRADLRHPRVQAPQGHREARDRQA